MVFLYTLCSLHKKNMMYLLLVAGTVYSYHLQDGNFRSFLNSLTAFGRKYSSFICTFLRSLARWSYISLYVIVGSSMCFRLVYFLQNYNTILTIYDNKMYLKVILFVLGIKVELI